MNLLSTLQHLVGQSAVASESYERYDSTSKLFRHYDGVREKGTSEAGFTPYAYPPGAGPSLTPTTGLTVAASGGVLAVPILIEGHMLLQSYSWWDTRTNGAVTGPILFALWEDRRNDSNSLDIVSGSTATYAQFSDTTAAKVRGVILTSAPLVLAPGCYWLTMKNDHASTAANVGSSDAGNFALNIFQQKTIGTGAYGSTLDFVAATWTKSTSLPGVKVNGRVFGESTAY